MANDVSVEAVLSKALSECAREFYREHGLQVQSISFDWVRNALSTWAEPDTWRLISTKVVTTYKTQD